MCLIKFNLETSKMRDPWPDLGCSTTEKEKYVRELGYVIYYLLRYIGCHLYDILGVYLYSLAYLSGIQKVPRSSPTEGSNMKIKILQRHALIWEKCQTPEMLNVSKNNP